MQGRTVKEYEAQLTQLQRQNFNLKLRLYLLEERMGYMHATDDMEDPVKMFMVKCSFSLKVCFLLVYAISLTAKVTTAKKQT
jgi:hypothetical protein